MVYVINKEGRPLMPTKQHGYVRILLKKEKARVVRKIPFTIQLLYETMDQVQPVILGVDPGRTNIGVCTITETGKPLFSAEVQTRNKDIPKLMAKRKLFRQAHRKHVRREKRQRRAKKNGTALKDGCLDRHLPSYGKDKTITCKVIRNKQARFSNRKRPDGWLTPTANQLLQTHVNLIRKIARILPISKVVLELNRFAFMRLDDPSVYGTDFQHGPLYGYENSIKAAVWDLQKGKCLLCDNPVEQYHHVRECHRNGSETVKNRVGLCRDCHSLVHTNRSAAEKLAEKAKGERKKYDALGVLNQIIPALIAQLSELCSLSVTAGWETKEFRDRHQIGKDHYLDAYVIACSSLDHILIKTPSECYRVRQFRRHDRQACERGMWDRNYQYNGKTVAKNRHRAFEQKTDSLSEYVKSGGRTDNLTIKHGKRAMKDMDRYYPGCQMPDHGRIKTLLKRAGGYYHFDDNTRISVRKAKIILNNAGLVFVSKTSA